MITYQPDMDVQQEIRKVGDWQVHIPLPANVIADIDCDDDASGWIASRGWTVLRQVRDADSEVAAPTLEQQFNEQAKKWDTETAHLSSPMQRFSHPSYTAILGMAQIDREKVIDLLLRDMKANRREWFWALSYLTHENPITPQDSGKLDRMIDAWVRWGKQRDRL